MNDSGGSFGDEAIVMGSEGVGKDGGMGFPREGWSGFFGMAQVVIKLEAAPDTSPSLPEVTEPDMTQHLGEAEIPLAGADNLRVFPSPASATDASLQLARQVARLGADAKQQIKAATRGAGPQEGTTETS